MLPQAVSDHYRAQQRLTLATLALVRREWAQMGDDLDASWSSVGPRLVLLTSSAQLGAAKDGAAYVPATLEELGHSPKPIAEVDVRAFAGLATSLDGVAYGSLDALLYGAVVRARTAPAASFVERMAVGQRFLDLAVQTQIADAARMSSASTITATPKAGWVRMVNPPCCQRCAVLAGKFYKSNQGFDRHPGCDCRHIPASESLADAVGIKIGPDDVKDLTKAQRKAIGDGADMNRVINSHRAGKRSKDLMSTRELAKRNQVRLTPKGIYAKAQTREEAIALLKANGYFV